MRLQYPGSDDSVEELGADANDLGDDGGNAGDGDDDGDRESAVSDGEFEPSLPQLLVAEWSPQTLM